MIGLRYVKVMGKLVYYVSLALRVPCPICYLRNPFSGAITFSLSKGSSQNAVEVLTSMIKWHNVYLYQIIEYKYP